MMRILALLTTTTAMLALGSIASTAMAVDLGDPMIAPETTSGITGYVDLTLGAAHREYTEGYPDYTYYEGEENEVDISGAARVAIPVAPKLSLQLDIWANAWSGSGYCDANECDDEYDYSGIQGGVAAHLAYLLDDGLVGGMVSVGGDSETFNGDDDSDQWATLALEAVKDVGSIRIYGQAGASFAIGGSDGDNGETDIFAAGSLAYFIDPNLAVSVNAGIGNWHGDSGDSSEVDVTWGLRIEKQMENMPFVLYAGYQGWAWSGGPGEEPDYEWSGSSNALYVGIRIPFGDGASTLRDQKGNVGLIDMNPGYGDLPQ